MMADDIPVAHTPPGGYGDEFPPPILAGCTEPLVAGAPDLRGTWRVVSATRGGAPVPEGIADARADGTEENGVHDVSVSDFTTPIHVVASYQDGAFVLRPVGLPDVQVTRRLDEDGHMIWTRPDMGGLRVVLERITEPPC